MRAFFRKLYIRWFKPYKSLDVQLVNYAKADELMRQDKRWFIHAPMEDGNPLIGMVWIEKREYVTE